MGSVPKLVPLMSEQPLPPSSGPGIDPSRLLLVVVGAHLRAEMADRPLAYVLVQQIRTWLDRHAGSLGEAFVPLVCSDIWYVNHRSLQRRPTISVGGPGVNALSAFFVDKLPTALQNNDMLIQLDSDLVDLRASVWGMNHETTIKAVNVFAETYLDAFLRAVSTQVEPRAD